MSKHWYRAFDPFLSAAEARALVELCARFDSYGMYSEEPTFAGIGQGLPARYDAARNFLKTGGRFGRHEDLQKLAARTNYFRETYAYGREVRADGIEPFLNHAGMIEAARALHDRPVIEPAIVFANLLVPGQELAVHTDVPEFRGINRKQHPQWLLVAMRHSELFEDYRMPIATGVSWFHDAAGGEFAFYPDGATAAPVALPVRYNTAVLLDTDSVFHGVDRLAETDAPVENLRPGMRLRCEGDGMWCMTDGDAVVARYRWESLRFSVSWKAYCFRDDAERRAWFEHSDDLSVERVVDRMVDDMRSRGRFDERPSDLVLVEQIIDEYIHYPPAQGAQFAPTAPAAMGSRDA
jgi:hypothetical protein